MESTIVLSISTSQLYLVNSCQDPQAALEALRTNFERDTLANKLFLKKQYFRMQMKNGTPMEKHLKYYMKELTNKLAAIGAPISEEDQVVTLLSSLPPSYSTLVTAIEARVDDVSLRFVQQALIHEQQNRSGQFGQASDASCGQADSVLVGVQKKGYRRKLLKCFECRAASHFRRDCPKRKQSNPVHNVRAADEYLSLDDDAFVVSVGSSASSNNTAGLWLVDSGASSQMTRE